MKNIYQQDGWAIDVVATAAVNSGDLVVVGTMFGVAGSAAAIGQSFALWTRGVFTLAKAAGALAQGAAVYWDSVAKNVTATTSGNTKIGVASAAAAAGDATVNVRLNPSF